MKRIKNFLITIIELIIALVIIMMAFDSYFKGQDAKREMNSSFMEELEISNEQVINLDDH